MTALVCKLRSQFTDEMSNLFNQEVYFIADCNKFKNKSSLFAHISDLYLKIYFEENNKIVLAGREMKYCDKDGKRKKIKLKDISNDLNQPEINIINNYLVDDKWDKIDW